MVEDASIGCGFGMVELIDDDDVEVVLRPLFELVCLGYGLDRGEDVLAARRPIPTHEELAEAAVLQYIPIGAQGLLEDLLAMRNEEQRRLMCGRGLEPLVVQCGDDRLACARGSNDEIVVAVVDVSLGLEVVEHFALMRIGPYVEMAHVEGTSACATSVLRKQSVEVLRIFVRVVRRKCGIVPVGVEGGFELVEEGGSGGA